MLRHATFAAFLTVCLAGVAWSQQAPDQAPARPNQVQATEPQQKPATNQQPAAPPPIIVNVLPTPKSEAEKEEERKERHEKSELDRRLVELTAELADFTAGLFYATVGLGAVTFCTILVLLIQARQMKRTVDASMRAERAYLYLATVEEHLLPARDIATFYGSMSGDDPAKAGYLLPWIDFDIGNLGKSAALVKSIRAELFFGKDLPRKRKFTYSTRRTTDQPLRPENFYGTQKCAWNRYLTVPELAAVTKGWVTGGPFFFLFVEIEYEDIFQRSHARGFGMQILGGKPYVWGGKEYNYDKPIKKIAGPAPFIVPPDVAAAARKENAGLSEPS